jgi:hypothetical protein
MTVCRAQAGFDSTAAAGAFLNGLLDVYSVHTEAGVAQRATKSAQS